MPTAFAIGIVTAAVSAALNTDAATSLLQRVRSLGSAATTSHASSAELKINSDTIGSNAMIFQMPGLPSLSNKNAKSRTACHQGSEQDRHHMPSGDAYRAISRGRRRRTEVPDWG